MCTRCLHELPIFCGNRLSFFKPSSLLLSFVMSKRKYDAVATEIILSLLHCDTGGLVLNALMGTPAHWRQQFAHVLNVIAWSRDESKPGLVPSKLYSGYMCWFFVRRAAYRRMFKDVMQDVRDSNNQSIRLFEMFGEVLPQVIKTRNRLDESWCEHYGDWYYANM